jgi:hypothetical protein
VADWPRPPYVDPTGPQGDDGDVVRAFLRADIAPHSDRLHVEGPVLLADRDVPLVLRLAPAGGGEGAPARAVLVRLDLPEDLIALRGDVEAVLEAEGMTLLDHDSQLAIAVGVQLVAARMSSWDLWGTDIDDAFADLRAAAVGGTGDVLLGGGAPPVGPDR